MMMTEFLPPSAGSVFGGTSTSLQHGTGSFHLPSFFAAHCVQAD